jgi:drug/metabolite transporter (DMT)-like permease
MNPLFVVIALLSQGSLATGQILLKKAMTARSGFVLRFASAIACMTLYFLIWLGLAGVLPLSALAPFDALGPVILVAAVHIVLKERLAPRAWAAVLLILAGVAAIALA